MKTQVKAPKVYKSITKGEIGIHKGTRVEKDGRIIYTLDVNGELRDLHHVTLTRWWKLVEDEAEETVEETTVEEVKPIPVLTETSTIEDLKQLNESGAELTEEQLQLFKQKMENRDVITEEPVKIEPVVKEVKKREPKVKPDKGVVQFFEATAEEIGATIGKYSEPAKRVVKNKSGKTVIFYAVRPNKTIKIFMKEQLDAVVTNGVQAEESHTYPKQFPFRLEVTELTDESKELLRNILQQHI